jgi:hypothetical protein
MEVNRMIADRLNKFLKPNDEKQREAQEIIELLRPEAGRLKQQADVARLERSRGLRKEHDRIRAERDAILPGLSVAVSKAETEEREAKQAYEAAQKRTAEAERKRYSANLEFNQKLSSIEAD